MSLPDLGRGSGLPIHESGGYAWVRMSRRLASTTFLPSNVSSEISVPTRT